MFDRSPTQPRAVSFQIGRMVDRSGIASTDRHVQEGTA
jgi:hypothetical protein